VGIEVKRWVRAASAGGAVLVSGCTPAQICGQRTEQVFQDGGGAYRCVRPEDCPRPSNVFVCVTDVTDDKECVSCTDTTCIRHIPEQCQ
jgi:hypothetical protein